MTTEVYSTKLMITKMLPRSVKFTEVREISLASSETYFRHTPTVASIPIENGI